MESVPDAQYCTSSTRVSMASIWLTSLGYHQYHHCTITAVTARTITAPSLHHHCTITAPSLHHHCTITAPSLCHHCAITVPSLCPLSATCFWCVVTQHLNTALSALPPPLPLPTPDPSEVSLLFSLTISATTRPQGTPWPGTVDGAVMVWCWCSDGTCSDDAVMVQSWCCDGAVMVQ